MRDVHCQHCYTKLTDKIYVVDYNIYCNEACAAKDVEDMTNLLYISTHGYYTTIDAIIAKRPNQPLRETLQGVWNPYCKPEKGTPLRESLQSVWNKPKGD